MRFLLSLFAVGLLIADSSTASAGLFGGFAKDGSYRRGSEQLCQPVSKKSAAPVCATASVSSLAALRLSKGELQRGAKAKVEVRKSGTTLELWGDATRLFVWDSGNVVADVGDVYAAGQWVAIEYSSRFGGRRVDELVVVRLGKPLASAPPQTAVGLPKVPDVPVLPPTAKDSPEFLEAMSAGLKWDKKRKHRQAIAAWEEALSHAPLHPEASYRLARSQMASKNKGAAIAALTALATSEHAEMGRWRVEARFDRIFKSLRLDPGYRAAVGIDRKPGELVSAYERLVATGGRWEQASIPCEQAEVDLELKRDQGSRFNLVIRSKCQGSTETTRLDGSWAVRGAEKLGLHFPNTGSDDEDLVCALELCSDASGEDCLRCRWDSDEILFRTVRR